MIETNWLYIHKFLVHNYPTDFSILSSRSKIDSSAFLWNISIFTPKESLINFYRAFLPQNKNDFLAETINLSENNLIR